MFPCLELIRVPPQSVPHVYVGQRWPVADHLTLGRSADATIQLPMPSLGGRHCEIELEQGAWVLRDFGSANGTWVNGQRFQAFAAVPLRHGDLIELPYEIVFRYLERDWGPDVLHGAGEFVAEVSEKPDDDARWRVWGDRLLELGHPLGERIVKGKPDRNEELTTWVGLTVRDVSTGDLELEWRHGFIRHATLRNLQFAGGFFSPLQQLLFEPAARFLQSLEIDAVSYARGVERSELASVEQRVVEALTYLASSLRPRPPLRLVRFGPFPQPMWTPGLAAAWQSMTQAYPRLDAQAGPLFVARRAGLTLLGTPAQVSVCALAPGERVTLDDDTATLMGPLDEAEIALRSPEGSAARQVGCRLDRESGQWWVTDVVASAVPYRHGDWPLRVNGREVVRQRLRAGDLLEPAAGLLFRFELD